jgi:hypothetical protein
MSETISSLLFSLKSRDREGTFGEKLNKTYWIGDRTEPSLTL